METLSEELKSADNPEDTVVFFADESSVQLLPSCQKTFAPCGQTPVIKSAGTYGGVKIQAAVGCNGEVYHQIQKSCKAEDTIAFLEGLLAFTHKRIILIWDNARCHVAQEVKAFLKDQSRLKVINQPAYSPEVNACELLWNHIKNVKLKNVLHTTQASLRYAIGKAFDEIKLEFEIIKSFFRHPDVNFSL